MKNHPPLNTTCYNCQQAFSVVGKSKEHIIPDALGGKGLTSQNLLCQKCNNEWGSQIDKGVVDPLWDFAAFIGVARNHGKEFAEISVTSDKGDVTWISSEGRKGWEIRIKLPSGSPIILKGTSKKDVLKKAKKKQKQLIGKYPHFVTVDLEKETDWQDTWYEKIYLGNHIENGKRLRKVGGIPFFRGITKILVNYAISNGVPTSELEIPLLFLREEKIITQFIQPFYVNQDSNSNQITHRLHLVGRKEGHLLIGYVELFDTYCFIALLNSNYYGPEINKSIAIDVRTGIRNQPEIRIDLSFERLHSIPYWTKSLLYNWAQGKDKDFQERNKRFMDRIQELQIEREARLKDEP